MFEKEINTGNSIIRTKAEVIWRDGNSGSGKSKSAEEKIEKLCPFVGKLVSAECCQWCNGSSIRKFSSNETIC
jgi:adenylylsulfate kinase-like enzyme